LEALYAEIHRSMQPLVDRKSELILQTQQPHFFRDAEVRRLTLGEIHNLDQFLHLHQSVGKALAGIQERFNRGISNSEQTQVRERLARLGAEIAHLRTVSHCGDSRDLGDALITLSLLDRTGAKQDAVLRLTGMYQALARRRKMTNEVLGEIYDDKRDLVHLLISGLGAYALVKNEKGLHQVDRRFKERTPRAGREVFREDRELVRVEVHSSSAEPSKQLRQKVKTKVSSLTPLRKRLLKAEFAVSVFDDDAVRSVEFWTTGPKADAIERALLVLNAQMTPNPQAHDTIIRHYDVGFAPRVKDSRTGRSTTRLDEVMNGELGLLVDIP
jgi:protein subunit release factor A